MNAPGFYILDLSKGSPKLATRTRFTEKIAAQTEARRLKVLNPELEIDVFEWDGTKWH